MPITDRESAQAWLKGQPHQVQVAFAARCALRVLPAIMSDKDAALRGLALPVLRAILTSGVAGTCPTPEVMRAASDAADASAHAAASAMSGGEGESVDVFLRPLWPGGALPEGLARQYEKLRSFWKDDAPVWTFWQSWYEDMLAGRPVDWDFLRQVVLLPNKDWEAGPERIASLIREMRPEVSPEPVRRDVLERQAARLVRKATVMEVTAAGVAALIDETVLEYMREARTNCLPDEFLLLNTIPPILRRIASEVGHPAAAGSGGALPAELARLKARVAELEAELSALRARSSRGLFSKALCEAAGKSLGDWKMWAALIGGCYVLLGDPVLTDRLPSLASTVRGLFPAPDVPYPSDVVMPPPGIDI